MQVEAGFSGEMPNGTWRKLSVSVDEMDLRRILHAAGYDGRRDTLAEIDVFRLLSAEANTLMYSEMATHLGYPVEDAKAQISSAVKDQKSVLSKIVADLSNDA